MTRSATPGLHRFVWPLRYAAAPGLGHGAFDDGVWAPPGRYTVRLLVPRLAKGLAPVSPAELAVELTADRPLTGVDFTVEKRDMPIIMKEIPR